MSNFLEKIYREKEEVNKIAQLPAYRKLKYLALFFGIVCFALFIIMLIWFETLSWNAILIMRGSAGLFAIFFVITIAIYLFRINTAYNKQRFNKNKDNRPYEKD